MHREADSKRTIPAMSVCFLSLWILETYLDAFICVEPGKVATETLEHQDVSDYTLIVTKEETSNSRK